MSPTSKPATIDAYIAGFPPETQEILEQVRRTIVDAAPGAREAISYAIPAFMLPHGALIYFAGYAHHISVYPRPAGDEAYEAASAPYAAGKGTLRFPLDQPIPYALITEVVHLRAAELAARAAAKRERG